MAKSLLKRILMLLFLFIFLSQCVLVNYSHASFGGKLLSPIIELIAAIGDTVEYAIQQLMLPTERSNLLMAVLTDEVMPGDILIPSSYVYNTAMKGRIGRLHMNQEHPSIDEAYEWARTTDITIPGTDYHCKQAVYDVILQIRYNSEAMKMIKDRYNEEPITDVEVYELLVLQEGMTLDSLISFANEALGNSLGADIQFYEDSDITEENANLIVSEADLKSGFKFPRIYYSPEEIFSGKVPMLDIDFISTPDPNDIRDGIPSAVLHETIASWYVSLRNLCAAGFLCVLVYIGIRTIISTSAQEKSKFRTWGMDWLIGLCLLFFLHYFILFMTTMTKEIIHTIGGSGPTYVPEATADENNGNQQDSQNQQSSQNSQESNTENRREIAEDTTRYRKWKFGNIAVYLKRKDNEKFGFYTNIVGRARFLIELKDESSDNHASFTMTRVSSVIIYMVLVGYTIYFTFIYMKRVMMMALLTLLAPLMAFMYPIDRIGDGKAQAFDKWFKEYMFNCLLQPFHLLLYTVIVSSAIALENNPLYVIIALFTLIPAEKFFKNLLGFNKASSHVGESPAVAAALGSLAANQLQSGVKKMSKKKKSPKTPTRQTDAPTDNGGGSQPDAPDVNSSEYDNRLSEEEIDELRAENIEPGDPEYRMYLSDHGIDPDEPSNNQPGNSQPGENSQPTSQNNNNRAPSGGGNAAPQNQGDSDPGTQDKRKEKIREMAIKGAKTIVKLGAQGAFAATGVAVGLMVAAARGSKPLEEMSVGAGLGISLGGRMVDFGAEKLKQLNSQAVREGQREVENELRNENNNNNND